MQVAMFKFGPGLDVVSGVDTVPMEYLRHLHDFNGAADTTLVAGLNTYTDNKPWPWAGYQVLKVNGQVRSVDRYNTVDDLVTRLGLEKPELVHTHTRGSRLVDAVADMKSRGAKVVHTVHGLDELRYDRFSEICDLADVVTSPSTFSAGKVREAQPAYAHKVLTFPNSTSYTDFRDDSDVLSISQKIKYRVAPKGEIVVTTAGRLQEDKGVYEAAQAVADLINEGYNLKFLHCGMVFDKADEDRLKEIFRQRGIEDRLFLYGKIEAAQNPNEMAALYKASDVFIIPSDLCNETFGLTALEALAMEVPTIVSDTGAMKEVYLKPNLAIGVKPRDVESIREALRYILNNYAEEKARAERASKFIEIKYHSRAVTKDLYRLYERLVSGLDVTSSFFGPVTPATIFGNFQ